MVTRRRDQYVLDRLVSVEVLRPVIGGDGTLTYSVRVADYLRQDGTYSVTGNQLWLNPDTDLHFPPADVPTGTALTLAFDSYMLTTTIAEWDRINEERVRIVLADTPDRTFANGALAVTGLVEWERGPASAWAARFDFLGRDSLIINADVRVSVSRTRYVVRSSGPAAVLTVGDDFTDDDGYSVTVENVGRIGRTYRELTVKRVN